jgi:hypothetical protein
LARIADLYRRVDLEEPRHQAVIDIDMHEEPPLRGLTGRWHLPQHPGQLDPIRADADLRITRENPLPSWINPSGPHNKTIVDIEKVPRDRAHVIRNLRAGAYPTC